VNGVFSGEVSDSSMTMIADQEHVWLWGHALALGQGGGSVQAVPDCLEVFHQYDVSFRSYHFPLLLLVSTDACRLIWRD
jgi:hypothetical protein